MEERRLRVLEAYNAVTEQMSTIKAKAETAALYNAQTKILENDFIQGKIEISTLSIERARRTGAVTSYEQARVTLHNSVILLEMLTNIKIIKEKNITYMLAVGGGSVIDGVKFLSAAANYDGEPWDILKNGIRTEEGKGLPFASVLTLPATGSEMNSGAVVSRREIGQKLGMGGPGLFPQFSILDPEVIRSIPKKQIANGITDAYTHVLEQYMTVKTSATLQDRFCRKYFTNFTRNCSKNDGRRVRL